MMTRSLLLALALFSACDDKAATDDSVTTDDSEENTTDDSSSTDDSEEPTGEAGNDIATASPVIVDETSGLLAAETIDPAGDRDFFAMSLNEGDHVQLFTASYAIFGEVLVDTVIRIYDPNGNFLAEDDDMPYRFQETDSAVYFQAATTGTYYVEVLEWGDWAGEGANGGDTFEYELYGNVIGDLEIFANDTFADADTLIADSTVLYYASAFSDYPYHFFGDFEDGDNTDIWPLNFEETGAHYMWSFWPGYYGDAQVVMSLYNPDNELVATTELPAYTPNYRVAYDVGIMHQIDVAGTWYLVVDNISGDYGAGNFYPGVLMGYTDAFATVETEPNDSAAVSNALTWTESTTTAGYFYARGNGVLPEPNDSVDVWNILSIDTDGLAGKYLNVGVAAEFMGSTLDAEIIILDGDGQVVASSSLNETDDGPDPEVRDVLLPDTSAITIEIAGEDWGSDELANFYYFIATVSPDPVYE